MRNQTPWVQKPPSEYVFEKIRFTLQPEPQRRLLADFEWARVEKTVLFATDYRHRDIDSPELSLRALPEVLRQRVRLENARETFNLPARRVAEAAAG